MLDNEIADSVPRKILVLLKSNQVSAKEITANFSLTGATISDHLFI